MIKLARVCSFFRLCHSAVEPRLIGSSCASGEALIEESYGVWAYSAGTSRMPSPANRCRLIVGLAEESYPFGDRQRKLALPLQFKLPGGGSKIELQSKLKFARIANRRLD